MSIVFQKMLPCVIHLGIHLLMHYVVGAGIVLQIHKLRKTQIFLEKM